MNRRTTSIVAGVTIAALPVLAAEVTPERLINADREPQNWLMNHRTYDAQRYSPLDKINRNNIKSVKLAYAVAIGGTSANENLESTPLAEDGYSTWSTNGAWSTRSTGVPATWAGSSGAWIPAGEIACSKPWCRALGKFRDQRRQLSGAGDRHGQRDR